MFLLSKIVRSKFEIQRGNYSPLESRIARSVSTLPNFFIPFGQEVVDLLFGFQLGIAISFLEQASQSITFPGNLIQFIIGELPPSLTKRTA